MRLRLPRLGLLPRRLPRIRQRDATDCGAACLTAVAAFHGLRLPVARVRQLAGTDRAGTSVLGLLDAATRLGLAARGVRGSEESLDLVPKPCIAHVVADGGLQHFVVLTAATARSVRVMDPANGRRQRLARSEFLRRWTGVLVLLLPGPAFAPGDVASPALARFWKLLRPHRSVLAAALAGSLAYTILALSSAVFVQQIVDSVLVDGNRELLDILGALMLVVLLFQSVLGWIRGRLTLQTGQRIDAELVLGYYRHLLHLPQRFFDTMRIGELLSRVNDAVKIRAFINDVALELVVDVLVLATSLGLMFTYSVRLALLALAAVPLYGAIFAATNRLNRRGQRALMESAAELESQLVESLGGVATIRSSGAEPQACLRIEGRFVHVLRAVYRSVNVGIASGTAAQLVSRLSATALLWIGARLALDGALTPGELMSCYTLLGQLTGPLLGLIGANRTVQDALVAADRLFEIMDLEREQRAGAVLAPGTAGEIRFRDVAFRYGARPRVFDGLELTIARGRITAVVGESGCGKSTLAALVQRVYLPEAGTIELGGVDLRQLSADAVRRAVGVVPQRIELFAGSVVQNIALGEWEPDPRRVAAVCRLLGIDEFVSRLPAGLDTPLGEGGSLLSGGQRQRIAIARALYRAPDVLVLDEATSALDSISEAYVRRALAFLRRHGKTILLIAHRLSTVQQADRIVVLAGGRVAEEGKHRELLAANGPYARLWRSQFPARREPHGPREPHGLRESKTPREPAAASAVVRVRA